MKFKVGDRVRFTKEALQTPWGQQQSSEPMEVHSLDGDCGKLSRKGVIVHHRYGDLFSELDRWLELAPALIQMGGEYQTRDGRKVRVLAVDLPGDQPVAAAVVREDGSLAFVSTWRSDGRYIEDTEDSDDLIPVPPKPREYEGWVNVYDTNGGIRLGQVPYVDQDAATRANPADPCNRRIACLHLKFREGEGL